MPYLLNEKEITLDKLREFFPRERLLYNAREGSVRIQRKGT